MDIKKENALEKINILAKKIGFNKNKEKTILNIQKGDNPDQRLLTLQSGEWDGDEPWFAIDENNKIHTIISLDTLLHIIQSLKETQEENFNLKLEKTIWQNIPVDFQDVWIVAMDEIKKQLANSKDLKSVNIDIEKVIKSIKKKYPNLFLNLNNFLSQKTPENIT